MIDHTMTSEGRAPFRVRLSRFTLGTLTAAALAIAPAQLSAQWAPTWVGVAETSGDDVTMLLASGSFSPQGQGLKPVVGLQAYWLDTEGGSTWSATPSAGLVARGSTGALQGRVGYAFREEDDENIPIFGGDEAGVVTSVQADYWDGGAYGLQGIGSYNWGSEYVWTRARATLRVMELDMGGAIHVGPEFVYQGELGDEEPLDPHYSSIQVGPILQWHSGNRLIGAVGAGWKQIDEDFVGPDDDETTWYLRLELVLTP